MIAKLWWMVHKDLASEWRARRVWPAMLLFGAVVALVFSVQMDLLPDQRAKIAGGLLWLAIFFAGMPAIDRSLASERDEGCWDALRLYPMPSTLIYLAKLLTNIMALAALECFIVPLFIVLCGVSLDAHPWHVVFIAALGNFGISAVGTLVSALVAGMRQGGGLLALVVLPLSVPVVLAAAEATRLLLEGDPGPEWWRWIQLLATFAVVFITAGVTLFDFAIED
ncbi:MAG: heme exporter protein CcmB [Thermoguttaceae bacterium]